MKKTTKSKRPGTVVRTIKTSTGFWEAYYYSDRKVKTYGTRLMAGNGLIICANKGFNTLKGAMKNINAVRRAAV